MDNLKHEAYLATLMAQALTLLMYQSEREHGARAEQTALVTALGAAKDAAEKLARTLAVEANP